MIEPDLNVVDRHGEVVHAAMRAFARGGYGGTTLADIAAEAGVSQPRISQIFGNKEQAFIEAHQMASGAILAKFRRNASKPFDPARLGAGYFELIANHREVLMMSFQAFASSYVTSIGSEARNMLEQILTLLIEECGADYAQASTFLARGWAMNHAIALDLGEHVTDAPHAKGLLEALTGSTPVRPGELTRD